MAPHLARRVSGTTDFVSQIELLSAAVAMLDEAGIPYMVVGSYASAFHGEPRMTQDIDMVVDPDSESIKLLVDRIDRDRFYVGNAEEAFRSRSMFNLIEPSTGWKVDFVVRKDRPFSKQEFKRRVLTQIAGVEVYVATAEDTMLAKLEWGAASGSDRQMDDVVAIAASQEVDLDYLREWASRLGVARDLEVALATADRRPTSDALSKPWQAQANALVLYLVSGVWRYAIQYEVDVLDGRLDGSFDSPVDAQAALLHHVETLTGFGYRATWRQDHPSWWTAALAVIEDPQETVV